MAAIALAALVGAGLGGVALADRGDDPGPPLWKDPVASKSVEPRKAAVESPAARQGRPTGAYSISAAPGRTAVGPYSAPFGEGADIFSMSTTGDIIMGSAPNKLPAGGGKGFFDDVEESLKADLVMGNLEQPLTDIQSSTKCRRETPSATPGGAPTVTQAKNCFAFRAPPSYARHLKDAGFELLNTANNHARDYGAAGYRSTQQALEAQDLQHTGSTDEITIVEVKGVKVAVVGFSSYAGANSLTNLSQARRVVKEAADQADVVVVQVHMGAEGSDKGHVKPGTETFFGENRGDPMKFSRAVIDSGADLVVGHGPHVLRGMEFYKDRLIAYSLGNFAGGGNTLSGAGILKYGGILKVSLKKDGSWVSGEFLSTAMSSSGKPTTDSRNNGRTLVNKLSRSDFGGTGATIGTDGAITPGS
jgi:hypothetical protein